MRREDIFMDMIGELDDKYIELAMPRPRRSNIAAISGNAAVMQPNEMGGEISKKDLRIYWITRALSMAAAAILIIGAAVLLIMNWDKIAVKEPERPGVITTVNEPVVTSDSTITEPDKYDPFLYYSDMDMPEPFAQPEITEFYYGGTDGWHDEFYNLWKNDFYMIDDYLQKYVGEERAMEVISGYKAEQLADNQAGNITRYRIDDTQNWYRFAMDTGLTANDVRRARQMADENWSESPASMVQEDIFVTFGSKEKIAENNKTEYCISVGEYVFSPRWLYYHTTEDYKAAGITRQMIDKMLKKYEGLGLTDEAWKAFREKLVLYCTKDLYDESAVKAAYLIETDNAEPFGDRAFDILENLFYGEWELADSGEHDLFTDLSFTYSKDIFKHEGTPISGIFETDEIYVIKYSNFGVGSSYIIRKSEPDVMYEAEIAGYNVGVDAAILSVSDMQNRKYVNRKAAVPELKSGELSVLGQKKLFHTYGKAFEDSFAETLEKDRTAGIETGMGTAYAASKDVRYGELPGYLADYTDDSVNMLLPYYCEKDGNVTTFYAVKSFMKNYKGEWDAVDIWTDEGISPCSGSSKASGSTIPEGMLGTYDLDALTAKVFSEDSTFMSELNNFLAGISDKELAAQYRKAFALGTAGCRDMEDFENTDVLRQYYGSDYQRSGNRAVIYDKSGAVLGSSSGYSFVSVMNAYLRTFSASYFNDVFPGLPFCRYDDEVFYRDASMVIPDCHYEFNYNGSDDRAVLALIGYAKDKATGEKTDEIIYSIEAIFDKTTDGWKCSRFGFSSRSE